MSLFSFFRRKSPPAAEPDTQPAVGEGQTANDPSASRDDDGFEKLDSAPPGAGLPASDGPAQADKETLMASSDAEDTTEYETVRPTGDETPQSGTGSAVRWGGMSITGNFRENNEDSLSADAAGRFFIVADGMGGQTAGEKASAMAVDLIGRQLHQIAGDASPEQVTGAMQKAIAEANSEIMALGNIDPAYDGMGTTVVAIAQSAADENRWVVGSVGDSRVYRKRDGELTQLTRDDSLTQALIDAGTITPEEARVHRYKNMLVKYLGAKEGSDGGSPFAVDIQTGDRFLLCSDGVTDGVEDGALSKLIDIADPAMATKAIIRAAQEGGSRDNISCIVIEVL